VLLRWLTGEAVLAAVLITIALGILLRGLSILIWTTQQFYPAAMFGWRNPPVQILPGVQVSTASLAIVFLTIAVYAGLLMFLRLTRWGMCMRAAGQNPLLAEQRGIRLHGVYAFAWGLSTFTASLAGMLLSLDSGVESTMATIGLKAFPAALVGGLDSLLGAVIGALIVAAAEIAAIQYVNPLLSDVVPFVVLLIVLAMRPWGLFGSREELDRV
jgi:branched-chain amino acid transport system permease protein